MVALCARAVIHLICIEWNLTLLVVSNIINGFACIIFYFIHAIRIRCICVLIFPYFRIQRGPRIKKPPPVTETLILGGWFLNLLAPCRVHTMVSYFPSGWFLIFSQGGFLFSPSGEGLDLRAVVS